MLHVWLIPVAVVLAVVICGFYLVVKTTGGSGVRTEGRTVLHKPGDETDPPP